ncbi:MAG TPA: Druantia anti-phage system protein DruA, partial [Candidatus Methylomirabilis sp.]|nr:Druantia anti-phage system protein DruA [Candidatus Methylomirabilis sp.]
MILCGREVRPEVVAQLRAEGAGLSQRQRGRRLCQLSNWIGPSGDLQISVGRQVVARLERSGALEPRAGALAPIPRPVSDQKRPEWIEIQPIACSLEELGSIQLVLVEAGASQAYSLWKGLLERYHYLGAGPLCGAQLRYLVQCPRGPIGAMAFSAAALRLQSRDKWIGWSEVARRE